MLMIVKRLAGGSSAITATLTKNISLLWRSDVWFKIARLYNSQVGFKPSYGATVRYGMFAYASSFRYVSYFLNVNDIAVISQVLYGKDSKDLKISRHWK